MLILGSNRTILFSLSQFPLVSNDLKPRFTTQSLLTTQDLSKFFKEVTIQIKINSEELRLLILHLIPT